MRVHPHENLTVCEIRYALFGPGRFDRLHRPHDERVLHVHQVQPVDRPLRPAPVRIVEKSHRPRPADCRSCTCDEPAMLRRPTVFVRPPQTTSQMKVYVLPDPQSLAEAIRVEPHGFVYGQMVPATGGLLDVFA